MRKLFLTLCVVLSFSLKMKADEGMWIPMLLQNNEKEMQEMGMNITVDDIYSINHSSMKDAIVLFDGGCTGEIVSEKGLLLTNHHCGFDWIQYHSTVEHDYLTNGFWAMSQAEELPCPGISAVMLKKMEDVTDRVLEGVTKETSNDERAEIVTENIKKIKEEAENNSDYQVVIKSFYHGNKYYMIYNEVFKDVRLVGAPPSNIGKFGGDTDNWVWPRHTGDFSIFRIYVSPDGKAADYSEDNVPYKPNYHFSISLKGANEGDFTFVFGYPARTNEYLPAVAVNQEANVIYPISVDLRGKILDIYNKYQEKDPKVRIQYASKHAGLGNGWKKWMGVTEGINNFKGIEKKKQFDKDFTDWALKSRQRGAYINLIKDFGKVYEEYEPYRLATTYLSETALQIEILTFAANFNKLSQVTKETPQEEIDKLIANAKEATKVFFKDYHQPIDEEVAAMVLQEYINNQPADFRPELLNTIVEKYADVQSYVDELFAKTMFTSEENVNKFLDEFKPAKAKKLAKDPALMAYNNVMDFYIDNVRSKTIELGNQIADMQRVFMRGQMEYHAERNPEKMMYPDANFTLRVTYGKIGGFSPKDAVTYKHFTTLDGIMQKENPDIYDYVVTDRLRELYEAKDYGRYADKDGSMHVAFIAGNHTTGGNSGSPILNADGHLLGLNFDRTWEGTMSDLIYDPSICRNISVDIRYVLFIVDKYAGASYLVDEMTIVE
ncbi:MAG: S46 family peptidase [Lentimicrobiaceae bacterium]|nr:S46 family peptidase [Lentimicrobiaceae bacterium]